MTSVINNTFPPRKAKPVTYRLVAIDTSSSITPSLTPSVVIWPTVQVSDTAYSSANGVIIFNEDCQFNSTFYVTVSAVSGSASYYADAERSIDGGVIWTPGSNSLRVWQVRSTDGVQSIPFGFNGGFKAGDRLRFIEWASASTLRLTTGAVGARSYAARRLTYNRTPAKLV